MSKKSAGILMYRLNNGIEFLLVHPGGPFWKNKDLGVWSIPKGEFADEDAKEAAKREFFEETGVAIEGELIPLTPKKQKGGKIIYAWAIEGDFDAAKIQSNFFEMEWPPKSGKKQIYSEIDKAEWFAVEIVVKKINQAQVPFIDEIIEKLGFNLAG